MSTTPAAFPAAVFPDLPRLARAPHRLMFFIGGSGQALTMVAAWSGSTRALQLGWINTLAGWLRHAWICLQPRADGQAG